MTRTKYEQRVISSRAINNILEIQLWEYGFFSGVQYMIWDQMHSIKKIILVIQNNTNTCSVLWQSVWKASWGGLTFTAFQRLTRKMEVHKGLSYFLRIQKSIRVKCI